MWLAYQNGDIDKTLFESLNKGDFYDHGALVWPHDPRSSMGGVSLIFGTKTVANIFADLWAGSLNHDVTPNRGVTWADIDVKKQAYKLPDLYKESATESGQPSTDNLANSIGGLIMKGAIMKDPKTTIQPKVKLENSNINKAPKGGTPACLWPMDRGQVIGNQTAHSAVLDVVTNTQLVSVQNKLGPQVAGGISGWLGKFAKSLYLDKALNFLNVLLNVHNATMLSRNLVQTLGELQTLVINAIGKQMKIETLEKFDVNAEIGKQFKGLIEGILGKEKSDDLTKRISKYNRILTAGTNLLNSVESMIWSLSEMMSLAGEYQGKVGNALKRSGVILENSYEAMQEKWQMATNKRFAKIDKVLRGIDKGTEVADNLTGIAGEVTQMPDLIKEFGDARKEATKAIKDAAPVNSPGNIPLKEKAKKEKEASASPEVTTADKLKAETDET